MMLASWSRRIINSFIQNGRLFASQSTKSPQLTAKPRVLRVGGQEKEEVVDNHAIMTVGERAGVEIVEMRDGVPFCLV